MFPVLSTSVETAATKRALRVLQRTRVAAVIDHAGVFDCRKMRGSSSWSDHAWGAAADLFPKGPIGAHDAERRETFHALIYQSSHRTRANRGRRLVTRYVIDHDASLIWTPDAGVHAYLGPVGDHVHGSFGPEPSGVPPCAR